MEQKRDSRNYYIDQSHNNFLKLHDPDFEEFFKVLTQEGFKLQPQSKENMITGEALQDVKIFILTTAQNYLFSHKEIDAILNYVRDGGSFLVLSRLGADEYHKTNMNDLTAHFGIYFENTVVKSDMQSKFEFCSVMSEFEGFLRPNPTTNTQTIKKVIFSGSCTLRLTQDADPLIISKISHPIEIFRGSINKWTPYSEEYSPIYGAYCNYGKGRVIALGCTDFLTDNPVYGISSLDNKKFLITILEWLIAPVSNVEVRDWILQNIGLITTNIKSLDKQFSGIEKTLEGLDLRLNQIESLKISHDFSENSQNTQIRTKGLMNNISEQLKVDSFTSSDHSTNLKKKLRDQP
jgi:hypothetical protein